MPRWVIAVAITVIGGGILISYIGLRPRQSDRDQILALIADAEQGINQRAYSRVLRHISDDYRDSHGYTKRSLKRLALQAARSAQDYRVKAVVKALVITSNATRAKVLVQATVTYPYEGTTKIYDVTLTLAKQRGRWLVVSADGWQGAVNDTAGGQ